LKEKPKDYLRLRLHVEDGQLSLVDAHKVEGPLTMEDKIYGNQAYEVTLESKRIAAGSIPDVGVNRSFPNPDGPSGQEGHYFIELPSYDFDIRIPRDNLSPSMLSKAEIAVYRIKGMTREPIAGDKSLRDQFGAELREVARIKGIPLKKLAKPVQAEINRFFR
jgi:hypothetical protein